MRTGIRLTFLKNGEPLLGESWEYKGETGVDAVQIKVEDAFWHVNKLHITDVIDTIQIAKDNNNTLYVPNSGVNGDIWPIAQRIDQYYQLCGIYELNMVVELEFPTMITQYNVQQYASFAVEVIDRYSWIKYWNIMTQPEALDRNEQYKCSPALYVQLMKYIYTIIKEKHGDINIGGPGIYAAIKEYTDSQYTDINGDIYHTGWLAEATGELYGTDPIYDSTEALGFLSYIDFFTFQGSNNGDVFDFDSFVPIITKLKKGIIIQGQRNNVNIDFEYISIEQGHFADKSSVNDMQLQAYRDLREYMNCFEAKVIPFKKQLIDEYYDETDSSAIKNVYGILYYYLGNERKPSYEQYNFVLTQLLDYSEISEDTLMLKAKKPYEYSEEILSQSFLNNKGDTLLTVIYPAVERTLFPTNQTYTSVTLRPALNRRVKIPNGTTVELTNPTDVQFKQYDFIVVEENLVSSVNLEEDLTTEVRKRLQFYYNATQTLLAAVPDDYNKEVYDTNFYDLLRSLGIEFGDADYEKHILEDNMYLQTAHGDAIWNNFGALIALRRKPRWDYERYREIVSGIIESLLHGATKKSIQKAIKCYTGFDVHVYEMFTDYKHYGIEKEDNWDNQYRFVVEVEKTLDDDLDMSTVYKDVLDAVNIVRPAHTIPIIMIVLVGSEDYQDWYETKYGIPFEDSARLEADIVRFEEANHYGWKAYSYDYVFQPNKSNLNSAYQLAPKYTLYDRDYFESIITKEEIFPIPTDALLVNHQSSYNDEYLFQINDETVNSNIRMTIKEPRFGYRNKTDILKYYSNDGQTLNLFKWGFDYQLKDDLYILYDKEYEDHRTKAFEEELSILYSPQYTEQFEPPQESYTQQSTLNLSETHYGFVLHNQFALRTFDPTNLTTLNTHRWGVQKLTTDKHSNDMSMAFYDSYYNADDNDITIIIETDTDSETITYNNTGE